MPKLRDERIASESINAFLKSQENDKINRTVSQSHFHPEAVGNLQSFNDGFEWLVTLSSASLSTYNNTT